MKFPFVTHTSQPISLVTVDLGQRKIHIPVAILRGADEGKTLLITAGNDGDEYSGIEAAYRIIEQFSHIPFYGTIIVIPVVNIPGFENEMSRNPIDGKFPKQIYPGDVHGTASEKIRYWLSGYVRRVDLWMDLHGGSLTEHINPYIHAWKSTHPSIDKLVMDLLQYFTVSYVIFQNRRDAVRRPQDGDCGYLMCEAGSFGNIQEIAIRQHVNWVHTAMSRLGMIHESFFPVEKTIFTDVSQYILRKNGIWCATFPGDFIVQKGFILGIVRGLDGKIIETIKANQNGILLWGKEGMRANIGDVVAGVGVI